MSLEQLACGHAADPQIQSFQSTTLLKDPATRSEDGLAAVPRVQLRQSMVRELVSIRLHIDAKETHNGPVHDGSAREEQCLDLSSAIQTLHFHDREFGYSDFVSCSCRCVR